MKQLGILMIFLLVGQVLHAQYSISAGTNTIDFTGYTGTGFSPASAVTGSLDSDHWGIDYDNDGVMDSDFGATNTGAPYAGGTQAGIGTVEVIYSYSVGSSTPAFGIRPKENNLSDPDEFNSAILKITNNTGGIITDLAISYDVYYRGQNSKVITIAFEHSSDNSTYIDPASLDFSVAANVGTTWTAGTSPSATVSGLSIGAGDTYYLKWIFEDAENGGNTAVAIDEINITPTVATPASTSTLTLGSAGSSTISSLVTSSSGQAVFDFTVLDDGGTPSSDSYVTMISQMIITEGASDEIDDWSEVIAGAAISDGSTTAFATAIGNNSITFDGYNYTTSGDLGYIADNGTKTYTVSIWFNTSITETIDNKRFYYTASATDFTFHGASSSLINTETVTSSASNNLIDVDATEWQFKNVPNSVGTGLDFSLDVTATDTHGNIDTDETSSFDLTVNSGPGTVSSGSGTTNILLTSGSFSYSDLNLSTDGTYTLSASTNTGTSLTTGISSSIIGAVAYRSQTTGNWSSTATWEVFSGGTWINASATPTYLDGPITVQNSHTVTLDAATQLDQVTIESGATLTLNSALTLADQSGENDIIVQGTLNVPNTGHDFTTSGGTIEVATNGVITTNNNNLEDILAADESSGVFIYADGAIFEYTNTSTNNFNAEEYFPDVTTEIPVLRVSFTGTLSNMNSLAINGILEVNADFTLSNSNAGTMDIRNGITGTGNMTCSTNGLFQMTGSEIYLGGSGDVDLGGNNDFTFGSSQTVFLTSDKEVTDGSFTFSSGSTFESDNYQLNDGTADDMTVVFSSGANIVAKGANGLSNGASGIIDVATRTINNGVLYTFSGTAAQSTNFSDLGVTTIGDLTVNNSNGVTLAENITINGTLYLTQGNFNTTSTETPIMSTSASFSGGAASSFIDGPVTLSNFVNAISIPVGDGSDYRPVALDPVNSSTFTVEHITGAPVDNTDLSGMADLFRLRYWDLNRTSGTGNVEVTLFFDTSADGITGTSDFIVAQYNTTSTSWEAAGTGYDSHTSASVTATTSDFSDFTVGTLSGALPVELLEFEAYVINGDVVLNWATSSELNNDYFEVLRSDNGFELQSIGKVDGAGTINETRNYQFMDRAPFNGNNYYQLRQTDFNGRVSFSQLVKATVGEKTSYQIHPNPVEEGEVQIHITGIKGNGAVAISLVSLEGEVLYKEIADTAYNQLKKELDLSTISAGVYVLCIDQNDTKMRSKLIVE